MSRVASVMIWMSLKLVGVFEYVCFAMKKGTKKKIVLNILDKAAEDVDKAAEDGEEGEERSEDVDKAAEDVDKAVMYGNKYRLCIIDYVLICNMCGLCFIL